MHVAFPCEVPFARKLGARQGENVRKTWDNQKMCCPGQEGHLELSLCISLLRKRSGSLGRAGFGSSLNKPWQEAEPRRCQEQQ